MWHRACSPPRAACLSSDTFVPYKLMKRYFIPRHVHFASEGDAVIFLDLHLDRYSMLLGSKAHAFNALISASYDSKYAVIRPDFSRIQRGHYIYQELVSDLSKSTLITSDQNTAAFRRKPIQLPDRNLMESQEFTDTHISTHDFLRFVNACFVSKTRLKFSTLERIIHIIDRRKVNCHSTTSMDLNGLRRVTAIYRRLRPLIPWDYLCLFDSLSLIEFLAYYQLFPSWVFAVRLDPWAAHCWVQHEGLAVNEDADVTQTFLPIMTV